MFLPGFDIGAMPNHLNRSSLIAPIARRARTFHNRVVMVTRKDCVLTYTGEQLDEADGDLMMALIFFAQARPFGTVVVLKRKEILRKIKTGLIGSTQYAWLQQSILRLRAAMLVLEAKYTNGSQRYTIGNTLTFNLIKDLEYDDKTDKYSYILDPRWEQMFGNREYSLIDWSKRMLIGRGQEMAKTLQRLVATSSNPIQRFPLDKLRQQMQYGGRDRDFKKALEKAAAELVRLELIKNARIGQNTKGEEQLTIQI
ncbi:hypothetical protein IXC47_07995 [Herminiimonas contaminans]|uniref:TrfA protein n=1 Tax=Herminiimonas contaminans TaxID=1111140 RepID=A0ABS0ESX9_9BURK|nr:hypothetical protein [Herminiimonas contaminans]